MVERPSANDCSISFLALTWILLIASTYFLIVAFRSILAGAPFNTDFLKSACSCKLALLDPTSIEKRRFPSSPKKARRQVSSAVPRPICFRNLNPRQQPARGFPGDSPPHALPTLPLRDNVDITEKASEPVKETAEGHGSAPIGMVVPAILNPVPSLPSFDFFPRSRSRPVATGPAGRSDWPPPLQVLRSGCNTGQMCARNWRSGRGLT